MPPNAAPPNKDGTPNEYLLVHDTRSVGLFNAAVLHRLLSRSSDKTVTTFFDVNRTRNTQTFWETALDTLPLTMGSEVVLCSITFWRGDPDLCNRVLDEVRRRTGHAPQIWSHRWPDGYADTPYDVLIPPYDLAERYRSDLLPTEVALLRLSVIASREVSSDKVPPSEWALAHHLEMWRQTDVNACWNALVDDLDGTLSDLRREPHPETSLPAVTALGQLKSRTTTGVLVFELKASSRQSPEKCLERLLIEHRHDHDDIAVGLLDDGETQRLYLYRGPETRQRPSFRWLLREHGEDFQLPSADLWDGPQDAIHLDLQRARVEAAELPSVYGAVVDFADHVAGISEGERTPTAGLIRLIDAAASEALGDLDLLKRYTPSDACQLQFDRGRMRTLIHHSNRTGELRNTLILRLVAHSAAAATFLFKDGGYNLLKLERLLEGVLIGLSSQQSLWLGLLQNPRRLRIDVIPGEEVTAGLSDAFRRVPEVEPIEVEHAIDVGILKRDSSIHRALGELGAAHILTFQQSETIGPSVAYALLLASVSAQLSTISGVAPRVLDIFAGSGMGARAVASRQRAWPVHCVDLAIDQKTAGLEGDDNVLWLKLDVRELFGGAHVLDRKYDVIGMDPPHSLLFDLLFQPDVTGQSVLSQIAPWTTWLVIYQGHSTQSGRAELVRYHLKEIAKFATVTRWKIGQEVLVVSGPLEWYGRSADTIFTGVRDSLRRDCDRVRLGGRF